MYYVLCVRLLCQRVPAGSPSRDGDVAQLSSPPPLKKYVLVSVFVFMALSTVFHSINPPDNSSLSRSFPLVSFLPDWSFKYKSL